MGNLMLKAAKDPIGPASFWKLLIGTVLMLAFGYAGETKTIKPWAGFGLGMCGWAFILFEIFAGESANASGQSSEAVQQSFNNMRIIVSLGWAIYPAGYFLGTLPQGASSEALNVTYNIADFVNKIAFVLACWSCAKTDSESRKVPSSHSEQLVLGAGQMWECWTRFRSFLCKLCSFRLHVLYRLELFFGAVLVAHAPS